MKCVRLPMIPVLCYKALSRVCPMLRKAVTSHVQGKFAASPTTEILLWN